MGPIWEPYGTGCPRVGEVLPRCDGIATGYDGRMETDGTCPYCGERVSVWVDVGGAARQQYVEDCSVCCRPWKVTAWREPDGELQLWLQRQDD